jgi:hypothetical protein
MKNLIRKILRESFLTEANKSFFRRVSLPYDYKFLKEFVGYETLCLTPYSKYLVICLEMHNCIASSCPG